MSKEVKTVPAVIMVPEDSVKLVVHAVCLGTDDKTYSATMELGVAALTEAKISGRDWDDDNATYELTDEGIAFLNAMEEQEI